MATTIEVVNKRPFQLTDNRFGYAKYPVCASMGCRAEAHTVVEVVKFGHHFHDVYCDECEARFSIGEMVIKIKPSAYQIGMAKFYDMPVDALLDLAEDERWVLQRFMDAYRKEDLGILTELIKENKGLIKKFWKEE